MSLGTALSELFSEGGEDQFPELSAQSFRVADLNGHDTPGDYVGRGGELQFDPVQRKN